MLADTAKLYTELSLKDSGFSRGMGKARAAVKGLNLDTTKLHSGLSKIGRGLRTGLRTGAIIGAGALGFLALNVRSGIDSLAQLEVLNKKTAQALLTTGRGATITAKSIRALSDEMESLTTVDDKVIQNAANILLSFNNVEDKAFKPALAAALDLSEGLGRELNSSIRLVGRALNDPIKGLASLTRVGVSFTDKERKKIEALTKSGKLLEAQDFILQKLNERFGGQAVAAADTYRGAQNRLKDAVEELQQSLAMALLPSLTKVSTKLAGLLKDPAVIQKVKDLGETIAGLFTDANIDEGVSGVKKFFGFLRDLPWATIKDGLSVSAQAAKKAVDIFRGLPPELQTGLIGLLAANKLTGGLVASGIGDLVKFTLGSLRTITATNVTVIGANVTGGGLPGAGVPGVPGAPGAGSTLLKGIASVALVSTVAALIVTAIGEVAVPDPADRLPFSQRLTRNMNTKKYYNREPGTTSNIGQTINIGNKELVNIDKNTATFAGGIGAGGSWDIAENARTERLRQLQMFLSGAETLGLERRAARLQGKIDALIASTGVVATAVRNKKSTFTVNTTFQPRVMISGTDVASAMNRTFSRNRFVVS